MTIPSSVSTRPGIPTPMPLSLSLSTPDAPIDVSMNSSTASMISVRGKPSFSLERLKTMFPCKSRMVHLNMAPLMSTPANRCDSGISSSSIGGLPPLDIPFPASLISPSSISSSVMFIMVGILKPVSLASSALYIEWFFLIKSKILFLL